MTSHPTSRVTSEMTTWTVGQVADLFDVTVRTLHHYDQIGLLCPSERSRAGYRLYTDDDLVRLQQIVVYRRLELPLEEIADLLDGADEPADHLRRQRAAVMTRLGELHELVTAIDRALEREMNDRPATTEELKELFGDGYSEGYQQEAEERWGDSDAWEQSTARTKRYTKADWEQIKVEGEATTNAMVAAKRAGLPADSTEAMDAAEAHRRHIHDRFYSIDHEFHRNLGDMYVSDPRFTKTYDEIEPGLAAYVKEAIHANADRHTGS